MTKSVSFARPAKPIARDPQAWINGDAPEGQGRQATNAKAPPVPMKRLTLDIPEDLHRRVKSGCAVRGEKIADVVRRYLDGEFPAS